LVIEGAKLSLKVAVNPDAAEGDMRPANKDELAKFFSSPKSGSAVFSSDSDSAKEFALYFALAALLAFLFENWLVRSMLKPE
jgi:hypothetical protein